MEQKTINNIQYCKYCLWYDSQYLSCDNEKAHQKRYIRYVHPDTPSCKFFKRDIYSSDSTSFS